MAYGLAGIFILADLVFFFFVIRPLFHERDLRQAKVSTLQTSLFQKKQEEKMLNGQVAFLSQDKGEGILWSDKMVALPRLLPANLWLEEVRLEENKGQKTTPAPGDPAGTQLVIRGLAVSDPRNNPIDLIGRFARALKEDPAFSVDFETIRIESIEASPGKGGTTGFLLQGQLRHKRGDEPGKRK